MTSKVCLVTGGAGFIGCALSKSLVARYDRVIALDNLHPQIHAEAKRPAMLDEGVELMIGDITQEADWDRFLKGNRPNTIVHLAAETGTGQSLTEATRHAHTNVVGLTRMLDALAKADAVPEKIVLTSSRAVYGEGAWRNEATGDIVYPGQRTREQLERKQWGFPGLEPVPFSAATTEPHPTSVYGATKLAQEHILTAWALAFGSNPVVLRLQNVYGPGQSLINPYTGIVSLFCRLAREGKSIPVYEDGDIVRDFVFIDDVADAIQAAIDSSQRSSTPYDVGSGSPTTIAEVARWIANRYDAPAPAVNGAYRHGDVRSASCDMTRTVTELGWTPRWPVSNGLERLCVWIDKVLEQNA
jgi:dTDP-L-rhamnose 4-epimerase